MTARLPLRLLHLRQPLLLWLAASLGFWATPAALAGRVTATRGQIELPTYGWAAVKHPYFRGTDRLNIYPYAMLDFLSREKTNRVYQTVTLENEYLRILFLPELGGKIQEVTDKTTGQPMFYVNHVIKPGLIGQCGAWTSGGVEWNTGPQGHTVSCMLPVEVRILEPEPDGSRSVAIGEVEKIDGTHWTVVVTLRPGRAFIEERIRIYNPTETIRPYYFWNCTAAPNTPGFRFIYPMTLGMDHSGDKFFRWPMDEGKDLTRGVSYQDAASIFAYHCDQDFFGSYNDDLDRGVVSFANHHQLPGKKAWTWGHGGDGTMHQADLTDADGPYNEVQTGPLLTQGEVGRLDPCEAVEWQEWWYPVHALGGFTYANRDLAVNATNANGRLHLRLLGTGTWKNARIVLSSNGRQLEAAECDLSPRRPTELDLLTRGEPGPFECFVWADQTQLARFRIPLDLPKREPPEKRSAPQTASALAEAGWQHFLFARFSEAEAQFRKALALDTNNPAAYTGLAHLSLDSDPAAAAQAARAALTVVPGDGPARYALAVAEARLGDEQAALDDTWAASLDPATAVPARALAAKLLLHRQSYSAAIAALSQTGPWQADPLCRNLLALAVLKQSESAATSGKADKVGRADRRRAAMIAEENLKLDPLDLVARDIRVRAGAARPDEEPVSPMVARQNALELLANYAAAGDTVAASSRPVFKTNASSRDRRPEAGPLELYWLAYLSRGTEGTRAQGPHLPDTASLLSAACQADSDLVFPFHRELLPALEWAVKANPRDGQAALYLGHLLFHLGRHAAGREQWKRAAELGAQPVVACRALGMAARTLDKDLPAARLWLERAAQADPQDAIVARDLANVLFDLADKAESAGEKEALTIEACNRLKAALPAGKSRSDFVALLARAQNRLGQYQETARMLDGVRVTIWEGAREVHDLFEQAHLALGEAHFKAGRPADALAEFNRALEYPPNLATGKLETTRQAHIHYQRGLALAALGRKADARAAWKLAADEPESKDARINEARRRAQEEMGR